MVKPLMLKELQALLPRFQATVEALVGGAPKESKSPKATKGKKTRKKRGGGAGAAIRDKLIATLKAGKGFQLREVVERSGLDAGAVQYHLRALRSAKLARVVGSRKEARWFSAK